MLTLHRLIQYWLPLFAATAVFFQIFVPVAQRSSTSILPIPSLSWAAPLFVLLHILWRGATVAADLVQRQVPLPPA